MRGFFLNVNDDVCMRSTPAPGTDFQSIPSASALANVTNGLSDLAQATKQFILRTYAAWKGVPCFLLWRHHHYIPIYATPEVRCVPSGLFIYIINLDTNIDINNNPQYNRHISTDSIRTPWKAQNISFRRNNRPGLCRGKTVVYCGYHA